MNRRLAAGVAGLALVWTSQAAAQNLDAPSTLAFALHGRASAQAVIDAYAARDAQSLAGRTQGLGAGDVRLDLTGDAGAWRMEVEALGIAAAGPQVQASGGASSDSAWLPLTAHLVRDRRNRTELGLDRAWIGWSHASLSLKLGRQALTLGEGLVFRPMDLFDPFSPGALDTEYKPGTDMAQAQILLSDGSDLTFIAAPRGPSTGAAPTLNGSSFALQLRGGWLGLRTTILAARDRGDWTTALELTGDIAGAAWTVEAVPTVLADGGTRVSFLVNLRASATLFGRNASGFLEIYRNGFGMDRAPTTYALLPPSLRNRVSRGQVFSLRRDYAAAGGALEISPLVTTGVTLLEDVDTGGGLALLSLTWSARQNVKLILGLQLPYGPVGDEFGGVSIGAGLTQRLAPSDRAYIQLRRYF